MTKVKAFTVSEAFETFWFCWRVASAKKLSLFISQLNCA